MGRKASVFLLRCSALRSRTAGLGMYAALVIALALPGSGCVRRRLNVRTNPPGALVYVDNQQIGTTPCSVDFTYYGTREIRLVKPGFETLTVNQPIPAPWWQYPGIDFVSENLIAMKIRDNRTVTYNLAPQVVVPTQELVDRANLLRQDAQFPVVPATAIAPVAVPSMAPPAAPPTQPADGIPGMAPQRLPDVYPAPSSLPVTPTSAVEPLPAPPM